MVEYFGRQLLNRTKTCIPNHCGLTVYTHHTPDVQRELIHSCWYHSTSANPHSLGKLQDLLRVRVSFVNFISAFSSIESSNLVNKLEKLGCLFVKIWDLSRQNSNTHLDCYPQHRLHPSLQTYQPAASGRFRLTKTWTIRLKMAGRLHTNIGIWLWMS